MTLDDLRIFVAVCQAKSLSAAARLHGCTQPAVSQHIARLERELRVALLERSAAGVKPTPAGNELLDSAMESLGALASGIERIESLRGIRAGSLTITTGATTVRHFLRTSVVTFKRANQDVTLGFIPADTTARCLELLKVGDADLGLVTVTQDQRGIEQEILARQHLRLLVPEDHAFARRRRLRLGELNGIRYIGLSERTTSSGHIDQTLAKQGVAVEVTMTVDDFDTACVFVELGQGFSIVPAVQAANFCRLARVKSVALSDLSPLPIGIAARKLSALSDVGKSFVAIFRRELKKMRHIAGLELT